MEKEKNEEREKVQTCNSLSNMLIDWLKKWIFVSGGWCQRVESFFSEWKY